MGKWGDGSLHGRRKGKVIVERAEGGVVVEGRVVVRGLVAWEKKRGSDGQVGEKRREKERKGKWVGLLHWASIWANK